MTTTSSTSQPTLTNLPADPMRKILSHLHPTDIKNLQDALPKTASTRHQTQDPILWRSLYTRDFTAPPPPPIYLRVTAAGTLDWHAAYNAAATRRDILRRRRDAGWGFPCQKPISVSSLNPPIFRFAMCARLGGPDIVLPQHDCLPP